MITATATTKVSGDPFGRLLGGAAMIPGIIVKYAELIVATAQQYAPVDTEALRDSIHAVLAGAVAIITAGEGLPDARAIYQEFGFHHYSSGAFIQNAYMRPAVEQHINAYLAEILACVRLG